MLVDSLQLITRNMYRYLLIADSNHELFRTQQEIDTGS